MNAQREKWQIIVIGVMATTIAVLSFALAQARTEIRTGRRLLRASAGLTEVAVKWGAHQASARDSAELRLALMERAIVETRIIERIRHVDPRAPATLIGRAIMRASVRTHIDPLLLAALIEQESGYRVHAVGRLGERGLAQIRHSTARSLGLPWSKAFSVRRNVDAGARYLALQLAKDRKTAWALNGYNGSGRPGYAAQVLGRYHHLVFVR